LEVNYCNGLRQRRYTANDCYFVQFKTVYEWIITPLRVEWRLNSATAHFLFMAVIYSFLHLRTRIHTAAMLRSATLCSYSTIKYISVVYMVTVSSHFEKYILRNSTVLYSVTVWSHTILRQIQHCNFIYEKSYGILVKIPLRTKTTWKTWQTGR
jgi:hypothetical protein